MRRLKLRQQAPFEAARYQTSDKAIAEYMTAEFEVDVLDFLLLSLVDVANARGIAKLAKETGLGRKSLYKAIVSGAKPSFDSVMKIARASGVRLYARAA